MPLTAQIFAFLATCSGAILNLDAVRILTLTLEQMLGMLGNMWRGRQQEEPDHKHEPSDDICDDEAFHAATDAEQAAALECENQSEVSPSVAPNTQLWSGFTHQRLEPQRVCKTTLWCRRVLLWRRLQGARSGRGGT